MSEPQYGSTGEQPSFDKPAADPSGPPPAQPGYGQAPPPQQPYGQPQGAPPQGGYPQGAPGYPPPQGGYPQGGQGFSQELSPSDQRMWATLAHAGGILLGFIAPLIVWLVQKDKGLYVTEQAKEALNFQITLLIGYVVAGVLTFVVVGFIIYPIIWVVAIVFGIIAAMASNKGENYRYPFALRLIN